jgi:GTP pyrophosphokinase
VNVLGVASRSDTNSSWLAIDMNRNLQPAGAGPRARKLNQVPDVIDRRRLHGG